jgi:hypothetical protein
MAITYDWILNPLTVKPAEGSLTDVVVTVDWRRTATDGQYSADVYGQVSLGPPSPTDYTAFNDLTKSQVQGWVVAALTQATVDQYDASLAQNIADQKNPLTIPLPPPWNNAVRELKARLDALA